MRERGGDVALENKLLPLRPNNKSQRKGSSRYLPEWVGLGREEINSLTHGGEGLSCIKSVWHHPVGNICDGERRKEHAPSFLLPWLLPLVRPTPYRMHHTPVCRGGCPLKLAFHADTSFFLQPSTISFEKKAAAENLVSDQITPSSCSSIYKVKSKIFQFFRLETLIAALPFCLFQCCG